MSIIPFLGFWLRFILVYRFNVKRMDDAIRMNEEKEKNENLKYGTLGLFIILLIIFVYALLYK